MTSMEIEKKTIDLTHNYLFKILKKKNKINEKQERTNLMMTTHR